jgi:hypothetical protein
MKFPDEVTARCESAASQSSNSSNGPNLPHHNEKRLRFGPEPLVCKWYAFLDDEEVGCRELGEVLDHGELDGRRRA